MFVNVPELGDIVSVEGIQLQPKKPHVVVRLFDGPPRSDYQKCLGDEGRARPSGRRNRRLHDYNTNECTKYCSLVKFGKVREELLIIPCECIALPMMVVPNQLMLKPKTEPRTKKEKAL